MTGVVAVVTLLLWQYVGLFGLCLMVAGGLVRSNTVIGVGLGLAVAGLVLALVR